MTFAYGYDIILLSVEGNEGTPQVNDRKDFIMNEKFDRRRKYYVVLDCETATLPYASNLPENLKKQIAIAKPLIYDLGWTIVDKKERSRHVNLWEAHLPELSARAIPAVPRYFRS